MSNITIYGFHSIESQINVSPENILTVFIQKNRKDNKILAIISNLKHKEIKYSYASKDKLDLIAENQNHQGIVAKIKTKHIYGEKELISMVKNYKKLINILMLDSIKDPRNLGACIRSARAFAVEHIVINKNSSCSITPLVYKTSAGTINQVKIFQVSNLTRIIKILQESNFWVIGFDSLGEKSIYETDLNRNMIFVMGSEEKGIKPIIKKSCDELIKIPINKDVESLNISVATGIALSESLRQRMNS